jgi:hypothetical protein
LSTPATLAVTIARFTKNKREAVVVALSEYKGVNLIDMRVFAATDEGDKPTPKGLALDIQRLPDLRAALERAEGEARRLGLIPEGGA